MFTGLGFRVQGLRVLGVGFRVSGLGPETPHPCRGIPDKVLSASLNAAPSRFRLCGAEGLWIEGVGSWCSRP